MKKWSITLSGVILLGLLGVRLGQLHEKYESRSAVINDTEEILLTEDARLFKALMDAGLIRPKPGSVLLVLPEPDLALVEEARRNRTGKKSSSLDSDAAIKRERLISDLYESRAGRAVRTEVGLWNAAHLVAAVRDNRPDAEGGFTNRWQVFDEMSGHKFRMPSGDFVAEHFGFVTEGRLIPGFSDWRTAGGIADTKHYHHDFDDTEVIFETCLEGLSQKSPVTVQIIGRLQPGTRLPDGARLKPCYPPGHQAEKPGAAVAHTVELPANSGKARFKIVPAETVEPVITNCAIRLAANGDNPCYEWHRNKPRHFVAAQSFTVATADNVPLIDETGSPTTYAVENGLLPLTGFGRGDAYRLAGILDQSFLPTGMENIRLTIDSRLQTIAHETLYRKIDEYRNRAWKEHFAYDRRGAVVILDASTGAILATATYPAPPKRVHPWDFAALAKVYPVKNPLAMRAWQGMDSNSAPGSTFKPVLALAALAAAKDRKDVARFIKGYPQSEFRLHGAAGLEAGASYSPLTDKIYSNMDRKRTIHNFGKEPLKHYFSDLASSCGTCLEDHGRLGLGKALRKSANTWFARLGVLLDGSLALEYDRAMTSRIRGDEKPVPAPSYALSRMASSLGFDLSSVDLAANLPEEIRLHRYPYQKPSDNNIDCSDGDVLNAQTGGMDLVDRLPRNQLWTLAQSSIGQGGVKVTSLQMARLAATIAEGKIIAPYLFQQIGETVLTPPETVDLPIEDKAMDLLRQGMKAVVETGGTAAKAFGRTAKHPDTCRVWGKTGTANVPKVTNGKTVNQTNYVTTWFFGWRDPEDFQKGEKRLAFACMITHAYKSGINTGGAVCAPIIADILQQVSQ